MDPGYPYLHRPHVQRERSAQATSPSSKTKTSLNQKVARQSGNPMWRKRAGTEGADSVEVPASVEVWGRLTLSVRELEVARSSGQSSDGPLPAGPQILNYSIRHG